MYSFPSALASPSTAASSVGSSSLASESVNTPLARLAPLDDRDRAAAEEAIAEEAVEQLQIKTPHLEQVARFLSGGNQQKIVLGKWLALTPQLLMLDEPTRGIDVGAKREIYRLMEKLAGEGMAILFVSSEMEEVLGMADRALVMHEGRIAGELARNELSEQAIMQLATGTPLAA